MISQLEYLNVPHRIIVIAVIFLVISNLIGEILELKGNVVPEFIKMRKYFERKKKEREEMSKVPYILSETQKTINEFNSHYSPDSLKLRDEWIRNVNNKLESNDKAIKEIVEKLNDNNDITMSLWVDSKRNYIISFASLVSDETKPVTREQFHRAFKIHHEYETAIENLHISNGECDIAMRIIQEAYERHMKNHTFLEDVRGF